MALIDKYNQGNSVLTHTPPTVPANSFYGTKESKLHAEYSISGRPKLPNLPAPSKLDLNGAIPQNNYRNTAPEGRTF